MRRRAAKEAALHRVEIFYFATPADTTVIDYAD